MAKKKTYKGKKITGTSTSAKVFKKSKVKSAAVGDEYLNTKTGHVYQCTKGGGPSKAEWKYIRTDVIAKPDEGYSGLGAPARGTDNYVMTATWKVPKSLVNPKSGKRATYLKTFWYLGISTKQPKEVQKIGNESATTDNTNLNNFKVKSGGKTITYTRASFYPYKNKPKLASVTVKVIPYNGKGKGSKEATSTRKFSKPRKPTLSAPEFNKESGEVSWTIDTDPGKDYQERHDTYYKIYVQNSWEDKEKVAKEGAFTETSMPVSYDASGYQSLTYKQYIRVRVVTWARGFAGDSDITSDTFFIAYPAQVTIGEVSYSGFTGTDKLTVPVNTNQTKDKNGEITHPIDKVKLEYLANVDYSSASSIPADANWSDSGNQDDGQCTALTMSVANLICDDGKWSYIRVVSYHANEDVLYRYSDYKRLDKLHKEAPSAADDEIVIVSALPSADGVSANVTVAWDADDGSSADDATGTELSWDKDPNAWRSTKEPSTHEFTWNDPGTITHKGVTYKKKATITIKGLEEGETYYVKARRYLEADVTTYGEYSNREVVTTTRKPDSIVALSDGYVAEGEFLSVSWTLSGGGLQKSWKVIPTNSPTPIASGTGASRYAQIPASRLMSFATNDTVSFRVEVSTGTDPVISEQMTVKIVRRPTLSISVNPTLTTNALSINANASSECNLIVVVSSQGAVGQTPMGMRRQTDGDTIHSEVYSPAWTASQDRFTTTIDLPNGLDFWDLASYTVTVTAVDTLSGLKSEPKETSFKVAWARKAPDPADAVTVTAVNEIDESGYHIIGADINLTPPANSVDTDVYDIYRLTGDGAVLIGESFPLTFQARDIYAPFSSDGSEKYRVAVRTVDGDTEYADIEYISESDYLRFDWADGFLDLPYGVSVADSYKKDVAFRKHMDGGTDGYWNANIERKGSLSTSVIEVVQPSEIDAARQLARFAGPVFVRTPEGSAYLADVQVTDLSRKNAEVMAVAFDATEVDITQDYMLPTPNEKED